MLPKEVPENIKKFCLRFYTTVTLTSSEKESKTWKKTNAFSHVAIWLHMSSQQRGTYPHLHIPLLNREFFQFQWLQIASLEKKAIY